MPLVEVLRLSYVVMLVLKLSGMKDYEVVCYVHLAH